jgi:fructokinase
LPGWSAPRASIHLRRARLRRVVGLAIADCEVERILVARDIKLAVLTRSEAGSIILHEGTQTHVAAVPTQVVDTTGAGDAYAAGFLTAYTKGGSLHAAGALGARAAALAISRIGARPPADELKALV